MNSKLQRAQQLLAQAEQMRILKDSSNDKAGMICRDFEAKVCLNIERRIVSLETLERWVKQAKQAAKKGVI